MELCEILAALTVALGVALVYVPAGVMVCGLTLGLVAVASGDAAQHSGDGGDSG